MNYSEMTDFEINCAVALTLGMSHAFYFPKSEDDFCEGIELKDRGSIWQSGKYEVKGYRVSNGNCFNPCNSWADAGPIIGKENISLTCHQNRDEWAAIFNRHCMSVNQNPLRAAMECFLMKKERENAA